MRIFARTPGRTPADRRGLLAADPLLPQANRSSSGSGGDSSSQPLADARRPLPASGASTSEEPGTSSTPSGPSTPSTPGGYLPMPAAFVAGQRDAVAMGLDCDEELGCGAGVNMAAADGTLDVRGGRAWDFFAMIGGPAGLAGRGAVAQRDCAEGLLQGGPAASQEGRGCARQAGPDAGWPRVRAR